MPPPPPPLSPQWPPPDPRGPDDADAFAADTASGTAAAPGTIRDPRLVAAILLGGFLGTVIRAGLADRWAHAPTSWPWATFAVNVAGALALGAIVAGLHARPRASGYWRPLLGTGLCGGLTTFSAVQLEVVRMLDGGAVVLAVAYVLAGIAAGLGAVDLGGRLGRWQAGRAGAVRPSVDDPARPPVDRVRPSAGAGRSGDDDAGAGR